MLFYFPEDVQVNHPLPHHAPGPSHHWTAKVCLSVHGPVAIIMQQISSPPPPLQWTAVSAHFCPFPIRLLIFKMVIQRLEW